jgi:hypothetical protein
MPSASTCAALHRGRPRARLARAQPGRGAKHGFYREETWRRKKDGSLFWARIALTALRDHAGQHVGFSKITMDLTDHKLLESCVKEREQTRRVLRAANAGTWTWRPDDGEVEVCENFLHLLGHRGPTPRLSFASGWASSTRTSAPAWRPAARGAAATARARR